MEQVVPWERMLRALRPLYPTEGSSALVRIPMQRMLRMYFVQQWYRLNDETLHDALLDMQPLRRFVGIDLATDEVPEPSTTREFKRLLEAGRLSTVLVVEIKARLLREGLQMRQGCFVDAAIMPIPNTEDLVEAVRNAKPLPHPTSSAAEPAHPSA
ncbi:transposase [uncultured Methylibium sp.]|uniref:transposase n=1 Tax=uncultured Methylibium sp. TaxID=381093 RepID=UPI0025DDA2B5|nr:transposase [uncultured Methylibium sp.]